MDAFVGTLAAPPAVTRAAPVFETTSREPRSEAPPPQQPAPVAERESERRVELDYDTNSLVYRMIDVASGVTVRQTPDEARLKLRAYIDGIGSTPPEPQVERIA